MYESRAENSEELCYLGKNGPLPLFSQKINNLLMFLKYVGFFGFLKLEFVKFKFAMKLKFQKLEFFKKIYFEKI